MPRVPGHEQEPPFDVISKIVDRRRRRLLLQIWGDPVIVQIKAVAPPLAAFRKRLQRERGILLGHVTRDNFGIFETRGQVGHSNTRSPARGGLAGAPVMLSAHREEAHSSVSSVRSPMRWFRIAKSIHSLDAYRQRTIRAASGLVLEIGMGSGLNLPLYGSAVDHVCAIDPSAELLRLARNRKHPMSRTTTSRAMLSVAKVCTAEANRATARGQHRYAAEMRASAAQALREAGVGALPERPEFRQIRERASTARAQAAVIVATNGSH